MMRAAALLAAFAAGAAAPVQPAGLPPAEAGGGEAHGSGEPYEYTTTVCSSAGAQLPYSGASQCLLAVTLAQASDASVAEAACQAAGGHLAGATNIAERVAVSSVCGAAPQAWTGMLYWERAGVARYGLAGGGDPSFWAGLGGRYWLEVTSVWATTGAGDWVYGVPNATAWQGPPPSVPGMLPAEASCTILVNGGASLRAQPCGFPSAAVACCQVPAIPAARASGVNSPPTLRLGLPVATTGDPTLPADVLLLAPPATVPPALLALASCNSTTGPCTDWAALPAAPAGSPQPVAVPEDAYETATGLVLLARGDDPDPPGTPAGNVTLSLSGPCAPYFRVDAALGYVFAAAPLAALRNSSFLCTLTATDGLGAASVPAFVLLTVAGVGTPAALLPASPGWQTADQTSSAKSYQLLAASAPMQMAYATCAALGGGLPTPEIPAEVLGIWATCGGKGQAQAGIGGLTAAVAATSPLAAPSPWGPSRCGWQSVFTQHAELADACYLAEKYYTSVGPLPVCGTSWGCAGLAWMFAGAQPGHEPQPYGDGGVIRWAGAPTSSVAQVCCERRRTAVAVRPNRPPVVLASTGPPLVTVVTDLLGPGTQLIPFTAVDPDAALPFSYANGRPTFRLAPAGSTGALTEANFSLGLLTGALQLGQLVTPPSDPSKAVYNGRVLVSDYAGSPAAASIPFLAVAAACGARCGVPGRRWAPGDTIEVFPCTQASPTVCADPMVVYPHPLGVQMLLDSQGGSEALMPGSSAPALAKLNWYRVANLLLSLFGFVVAPLLAVCVHMLPCLQRPCGGAAADSRGQQPPRWRGALVAGFRTFSCATWVFQTWGSALMIACVPLQRTFTKAPLTPELEAALRPAGTAWRTPGIPPAMPQLILQGSLTPDGMLPVPLWRQYSVPASLQAAAVIAVVLLVISQVLAAAPVLGCFSRGAGRAVVPESATDKRRRSARRVCDLGFFHPRLAQAANSNSIYTSRRGATLAALVLEVAIRVTLLTGWYQTSTTALGLYQGLMTIAHLTTLVTLDPLGTLRRGMAWCRFLLAVARQGVEAARQLRGRAGGLGGEGDGTEVVGEAALLESLLASENAVTVQLRTVTLDGDVHLSQPGSFSTQRHSPDSAGGRHASRLTPTPLAGSSESGSRPVSAGAAEVVEPGPGLGLGSTDEYLPMGLASLTVMEAAGDVTLDDAMQPSRTCDSAASPTPTVLAAAGEL